MLMYSICLDLLSNVFVEMSEPFVRHVFNTHDQLLLWLNAITCNSARRSQLTGEPAHCVCFHRVYSEGNFLDAMAGAALESALLKARLAARNLSQPHPVLAGRTHRPLNNGR